MYWISYADLHRDLAEWASTSALLQDAAAFVGIPRSGLLVANILALHLNKHLLPLRFPVGTAAAAPLRRGDKPLPAGPIVVLDDSCLSGRTIQEHVRLLGSSGPGGRQVHYAVPYVRQDPAGLRRLGITEALRVIPRQAVFAWNWAHQRRLERAVVDLDGVIHPDVADGFTSAPEAVRPLRVPTYAPLAIATGRREKYRRHTEDWLRHWGVPPCELRMMPTDKDAHADVGGVIGHKQSTARAMGAAWFVESSAVQAEAISTVVPTLCTENWRMYANGRPRGD